MIKGLILVILGAVIGIFFSLPIIGSFIVIYGVVLIEDAFTIEERQIIRSINQLIKSVLKVMYFALKEKIFRIKPKNN